MSASLKNLATGKDTPPELEVSKRSKSGRKTIEEEEGIGKAKSCSSGIRLLGCDSSSLLTLSIYLTTVKMVGIVLLTS